MARRKTTSMYGRAGRGRHKLYLTVRSPRIFANQFSRTLRNLCVLGLWCGLFYFIVNEVISAKKCLIDENEEFALRKIELSTNGSITTEKVQRITGLSDETILFTLNSEDVEEQLSALPEVIAVSVTRVLPNTLVVNVEERIPTAWLHAPSEGIIAKDPENGVLIGLDGYIYKWVMDWDLESTDLPILTLDAKHCEGLVINEKINNQDALVALSLIHSHLEIHNEEAVLKTVKVENFYTLKATYENEMDITFGMHDHTRQLMDLRDICAHAKFIKKRIDCLDLRPVKNIPGKYKQISHIQNNTSSEITKLAQ